MDGIINVLDPDGKIIKNFITTTQAAEWANVHRSSIHRYIKTGKLVNGQYKFVKVSYNTIGNSYIYFTNEENYNSLVNSGAKIFICVYDINNTLIKTFPTMAKTAEWGNISVTTVTVKRYKNSGKLLNGQYKFVRLKSNFSRFLKIKNITINFLYRNQN